MLSIFSCASWPSVCLLWKNVYLDLLPIFYFFYFYFFLSCMNCLYIVETADTLWNKASSHQCSNPCPAQYPAMRHFLAFLPLSLSCSSCSSLQAFSNSPCSSGSSSAMLKWEDLLQGLHIGLRGQQQCLLTLLLHTLPSAPSSHLFSCPHWFLPALLPFFRCSWSLWSKLLMERRQSWGRGSFSPSRGLLFSPKNSPTSPASGWGTETSPGKLPPLNRYSPQIYLNGAWQRFSAWPNNSQAPVPFPRLICALPCKI